jgi:hypothetical protein
MQVQQTKLLAAYNRTMNQQLYAVCAELTDSERRRDRQAFFRSIAGTLNHLLLVDRLWFGSFTGKPVSFAGLDEELYADFEELRRERDAMDVSICEWAAGLSEGPGYGIVEPTGIGLRFDGLALGSRGPRSHQNLKSFLTGRIAVVRRKRRRGKSGVQKLHDANQGYAQCD